MKVNQETSPTKAKTVTIPCLEQHIEALNKLSKIATVDPELILSTMILEELEDLDTSNFFSMSHALREFKLPSSKASYELHPLIWEHLRECAEAVAISPERLLSWCFSNRCHQLRENIDDHELSCTTGFGGIGKTKELHEIASKAVSLGVSLNRENPICGLFREERWQSLGGGVCPSDRLNFEYQFFHSEDMGGGSK